jgi:predicted nuclease with TOPRIM domain
MNLHKKQLIVSALAIVVLTSIVFAPASKALNFNFKDNFLSSITVSGNPDVTKPGGIVTANVTGRLFLANQSAIFHIKFYLDTLTQSSLVIVEADLALPINNGVGTVQYAVPIPPEALNNTYLYASVYDDVRNFTKIPVSLIQNPTYSELQSQVSQLQTQVASLNAQLNNIQSNNTSLQSQINILQSEKALLQVQVNNLQGNNSALQAQLSILDGSSAELQSQLNSLQAEKAALQLQVSSLQAEKTALQAQVADLQANNTALESQVGDLQSNKTALQSLVTNLQGNNTELLSQVNALQFKVNNLQLNNSNLQAIVDTFSLQIASLELQVSDLQSQNSTNSILMYLATGVAATFIAVTGYFLFMLLKRKKTTEEPSLY